MFRLIWTNGLEELTPKCMALYNMHMTKCPFDMEFSRMELQRWVRYKDRWDFNILKNKMKEVFSGNDRFCIQIYGLCSIDRKPWEIWKILAKNSLRGITPGWEVTKKLNNEFLNKKKSLNGKNLKIGIISLIFL